jgi:2-dehydro-3-deoxy-D-gluconate 5-dehydrogenase
MARPTPIDLFSIRGKTAICTGATGSLGSELCLALAEAGANIVSIQLETDPLGKTLKNKVQDLGWDFHVFLCDVGDSAALREVFQEIWERGIAPDIFLNGVAINRHGTVEELSDDIINKVCYQFIALKHTNSNQIIAVNLQGAYVAVQEFGKQLLKLNRPGKIINIGSVTCYVGMLHTSAYASTKGGLLQMTKAFSNELASKNIQVNCICPG